MQKGNTTPSALHAIPRTTIADHVAAQVRHAIVRGTFPQGSAISEVSLAQQLAVSRIPVREALIELEHDGIVISDHRGRTHVREFTADDIEEISSLRLNLEVMSARLAAKNHRHEDLTALQQNISTLKKEKDIHTMSQLDVEFHDLVMQAAGHSRLIQCWRTVRCQFEVLLAKAHRWQKQQRIPVNNHALRGHLPIFNAIAAKDPNAAAKAMLQHIREWAEWMPLTNPR